MNNDNGFVSIDNTTVFNIDSEMIINIIDLNGVRLWSMIENATAYDETQ